MSSRRDSVIETQYLLHRVGDGDQAAVAECIDRYGGLVWSLARRVGLPDSEAEDAVQEVFAAVWSNAAKYDPSIASETAFVAMIARRRLIDRRRKVGRQPARQSISEELDAAPPVTTPSAEVSEEAQRAAEALTRLSPEQQRVLRLSVYEGLSHELISRATGFPLGTVKTHARRGLIKLRELLKQQSDSDDAGGETPPRTSRKEGAT